MRPSDLNYQHLRYFRAVAHEGSVLGASQVLHLAPSTISGQIKTLEQELGQPLLQRAGRSVVLTRFGERVLEYADAIFELGESLVRTAVQGDTREQVRVGVSNVLPKFLMTELLRPAVRTDVELHVQHGSDRELLGALSVRQLDVVFADTSRPAWMATRGSEHEVMESGIAVFGTAALAARVGPSDPETLGEVPWVVPPSGTTLRSGLEAWWDELGIAPQIAAVVDDSALLKALGNAGAGVFATPTSIHDAVIQAFDVTRVAATDAVRTRVVAITSEHEPSSPILRALCGVDAAPSG